MGRLLSLLGLEGVVVAALVAGPASPAQGNTVVGRASCGTAKQYRFLYWPKGHPAIPSVGFPAFAPPHFEAYSGGGSKFPNSQSAGYASAGGAGFAKKCKPQKVGNLKPGSVTVATQTTQLVCAFPKAPLHQIVRLSSGGFNYVVLVPPDRLAVTAQFTPKSTLLAYDAKLCHTAPAPG